MDIFDDTIIEIQNWFDDKRKTEDVFSCKTPISIGQDSSGTGGPADRKSPAGIILKEDTHVELGHPSAGSCSATLATHNDVLVDDGRITLVGPDIPESYEERLPFGQVIIASITGPSAGEASPSATAAITHMASRMDRIAHGEAQSDGYMIRSVPNLIWARVSKDGARKGFSLKQLGETLITALRRQCDNMTRCEVFFITRSKKDIEALEDIIEVARAKTRKLDSFSEGPDGEFECTEEQDCDTCPEQVVCDNIRDVIKIRKGDRVITFGKDEVTVRTQD